MRRLPPQVLSPYGPLVTQGTAGGVIGFGPNSPGGFAGEECRCHLGASLERSRIDSVVGFAMLRRLGIDRQCNDNASRAHRRIFHGSVCPPALAR